MKHQRGIAPILIIIVVSLAVLGIGGFVYWGISSYNKNESGSPTKDSATLSEECVARTGDENICHLGAIDDLSKYSMEARVVMRGENGSLSTIVRFDGKGNSEVDLGDGLAGKTINGRNYVHVFDNWYYTDGEASQMPDNPLAGFSVATTAGITYQNLGKEPCGDAMCFRYRMSGGILGDGVVVALFGDEDYLPRYYETTGGLFGSMTITIEYKSVTITAPEGALPISSLTP